MKHLELRKIIREEIGNINTDENWNPSQTSAERMDGIANMQTLSRVRSGIAELCSDWINEGFEVEDCIEYFSDFIKYELYD